MAKILKIYSHKDPILRTKCRKIDGINSWVLGLAEDMWMTMLMSKAVGLAANQVGHDYRMIVVNGESFQGPMINPTIVEKSKYIYHYAEGCLSIPGYAFDTGKRSDAIKVRYTDLAGKDQEEVFLYATAVIIQHEIDHLDGILMSDHSDIDFFS
jgi:peptide deformylase